MRLHGLRAGRGLRKRIMAETGEGPAPGGGPAEDAALRARLEALSTSLQGRGVGPGGDSSASGPAPSGVGQAMSLGFRVMSEFVAAVVVGAVVGWAIDRGLGSSPLALIVFVALGTAAGFWNVYRIAARPTGVGGGPI